MSVKIRILCVGKLANPHLRALAEDYRDRLRRLADVEIVEFKDATDRDPSVRLAREAERIRAETGPLSECLLLDETGEAMDSRELSRFLERLETSSTRRLTLVVGSSHGVDAGLKADIPRKLQLSRFTLTHEWARVLLLEQLYRAHCIKRNIPYHH